jgi:hypothetical protein
VLPDAYRSPPARLGREYVLAVTADATRPRPAEFEASLIAPNPSLVPYFISRSDWA